jgi:excisionase family DNA binding protein
MAGLNLPAPHAMNPVHILAANWRDDLERLIAGVPSAEYAALVGELSRHQAVLLLQPQAPSPAHSDDSLLTAEQVASRYGVSKAWVYRHQDKLRAIRLSGRALRFRESAVRRFLTARE